MRRVQTVGKSVTISSKWQVVIPRTERERLKLSKGQKLSVVPWDGMFVMMPDRDLSELEGAFPNLSADGLREQNDRM